MKASAIAHPIQGLIKYHGLRDPVRRIPFHDSISVCTGPTHTHTTVAVVDDPDAAEMTVDGAVLSGRAMQRAETVVNAVRERVGTESGFRIESRNDFPQFVGLGSSSSGFAALAVAAAGAYGWKGSSAALSEVARLGAGSAARAVTGGVSIWRVEGERSYSECLLPADDLDWSIIVPLVEHEEPTEGVHEEVLQSPLFQGRLDYLPESLRQATAACQGGDLHALWALAEADTLNLHAITMTAGRLTWQPATVAVMRTVQAMRQNGTPVWFSIDTGATAYLNTPRDHENTVAAAVQDIDGVADVLRLHPAGPARLVDEHLF